VRANGDGIDLSAQISFARQPVSQNLDVTITIKRGEYVVLGERTAAADKTGLLAFFVVHWPQGQ
jgi:hypothetical protein